MNAVTPIFVSETARRNFVPVSEGTHVAICVMVVDLGLQDHPQWGVRHQVWISWEIPDEIIEFEKDGEKMSGPARIGRAYTLSLNEKATLRHTLDSWRGRKFTPEELKKFDITAILGAPCMLSVVHAQSADGERVYANIAGVLKLAKGTPVPTTESELLAYSPSSNDDEVLAKLPQFLQQKIADRVIYEKTEKKSDKAESEDFDDEIPF